VTFGTYTQYHVATTESIPSPLDSTGDRPGHTLTAPFDARETWTQIAKVDNPACVEAVPTGEPRGRATSQGFRWSPEFAESVARIWIWAAGRSQPRSRERWIWSITISYTWFHVSARGPAR
jgi:hypothetical protein